MPPTKYAYELIVPPSLPKEITIAHVGICHRRFKELFDNEKGCRTERRSDISLDIKTKLSKQFTDMINKEQAKAVKELKSRIKDIVPDSKVRDSMYKAEKSRVTHFHADPIIEGFEREYSSSRPDIVAIKDRIKRKLYDLNLDFYIAIDDKTLQVSLINSDYDDVLVAVIYLGDKRFYLKKVFGGGLRDVYGHLNKEAEYVMDANGFFVRRYVYRNLATYDEPSVKGLKSRDGEVPDKNIITHIIRHLRAAQQGGSYFISFTTTKHHIYGSTGSDFFQPANGQVIVDLAMIEQKRIFDVHSLAAVQKIINVQDLRWGLQYKEGDSDYEANAAARDTVRTRELLIMGSVPKEAIVSMRKGDNVWKDLDGTNSRTDNLPKHVFPDD